MVLNIIKVGDVLVMDFVKVYQESKNTWPIEMQRNLNRSQIKLFNNMFFLYKN